MPDHVTLTSCGHFTWGLSSAVDLVCDFASKGAAEEEALRLAEDLGPDAHGLGPKATDPAPNPISELYDDLCEQEAADRAAGREWE